MGGGGGGGRGGCLDYLSLESLLMIQIFHVHYNAMKEGGGGCKVYLCVAAAH